MTKGEILNSLKASGEISRFTSTPTWIKAFDFYNSQNTQKKRMSCGTCYRDVLAWLQS